MEPRQEKRRLINTLWRQGERGGVALEYVLVTIFAALVGASLLGVASKVFQQQIESIAAEAGLDLDEFNWNPFTRE